MPLGAATITPTAITSTFPTWLAISTPPVARAICNGLFPSGTFNAPGTFGAEGNETYNSFRQPGFAQWDTALLKNTAITERVNFQLRFEFFNVFNRANLNSVDVNLPDGNFGKVTGQYTPRFLQFGGNLTF